MPHMVVRQLKDVEGCPTLVALRATGWGLLFAIGWIDEASKLTGLATVDLAHCLVLPICSLDVVD
jgi:hypothetical protein